MSACKDPDLVATFFWFGCACTHAEMTPAWNPTQQSRSRVNTAVLYVLAGLVGRRLRSCPLCEMLDFIGGRYVLAVSFAADTALDFSVNTSLVCVNAQRAMNRQTEVEREGRSHAHCVVRLGFAKLVDEKVVNRDRRWREHQILGTSRLYMVWVCTTPLLRPSPHT